MCIYPIRKTDRVAIYIDNSNLFRCANIDHVNSRINYPELVNHLLSGRDLVDARVYDSYLRNQDGSINENLPRYLARESFTLCFRDSYDPVRKVQKEVDVDLATDMVLDARENRYDVAILVSGDGDMIPAVEKVKAMGKTVEIASFAGCTSEKLWYDCTRRWDLSKVPIIELLNPAYPVSLYREEAVADA